MQTMFWRKPMQFTKMHGAGNDFILIRDENSSYENYSYLAKQVCHRRFGVGADGLMVVKKSTVADIRMMYYNSDGSLAEMCGNGIRCFSNFVYEKNIVSSSTFTVETLAGIKTIKISEGAPNERLIGVAMGTVQVHAHEVPVKSDKTRFFNQEIQLDKGTCIMSSVRMGVPHTVILVDDISKIDVVGLGKEIETLDMFPERTNVNFAEVINKAHMKVDTWERGAGHTLACGTGVCSAVYVAYKNELTNNQVVVDVPGGQLEITINDDDVYMEGKAVFICTGEYSFNEK